MDTTDTERPSMIDEHHRWIRPTSTRTRGIETRAPTEPIANLQFRQRKGEITQMMIQKLVDGFEYIASETTRWNTRWTGCEGDDTQTRRHVTERS